MPNVPRGSTPGSLSQTGAQAIVCRQLFGRTVVQRELGLGLRFVLPHRCQRLSSQGVELGRILDPRTFASAACPVADHTLMVERQQQ